MPNRETVSALVSAFNVHNYFSNTVKTNFKLQSKGKEDYIVVSFDKSMGTYQCRRYLDSIKRKIIREFYGIEKGNKAEILDTAKLIFDVNSFPFENYKDVESFPLKNYKGDWFVDKQGSIKFVTPVDDGVIFNLKSHLASSLAKDIREDMQISSTTVPFNKGKYLCCSKFDNKELSQQFKNKFLSRMRERYKNVPKKPLEVNDKDNSVYIKDVFDNARFIDSVTRYKAWLTGMDLGVGNDVDHSVKSFKNMIIRSTYSVTKVMIDGFILAPPLGRKDASVLVPVILDDKGARLLTHEEALKLNYTFNNVVLGDLNSKTQAKLSVNGSSEVYGIDFSNPYISHCVITKIIKNSVINKDHELSIDPELRFRALSRSPSTELSNMELESPTCSQSVASKDSPRQGSEGEEGEEGPRLLNYVNSVRTSDRPLTDLSYATTSCGVPGISRDLSAGEGTLTEANIPDQKRSSSIPSPTAWNDSMSLNSVASNEEPEKQQVTDESDLESNDECSKAKPQSESPSSRKGSESNSFSGSSTPSKVRQSSILESLENTSFGGIPEPLPQDAVSKPNVPGDRNSKISKDSGFESLERPQSNSSITTSTVPGISESRKDLNPPVDNKRPQSLPLADFSTCASNKTVKAFLCFLDYFSSPEGKKQLPLLLSSEAGKQLSSISDPREQENLLDFLFSTEGNKQLCSLFSSENKQQLHSLFSPKGKELLFSPSPEGQKTIPLVLSPEGKERLPLLLSPEGEQISKPFSPEAGNIISLLICSRVEPKNMSHRSFRDKLAKWLHRNSSLSKVASSQEKPLTNDEKKELRPFLCPKLQKKLDSNSLEDAQLKYLLYTPGGRKKLNLLLSSPEKEGKQLLSDLQKVGGNASTSFADSGCYSGSSSQKSTSDTGSDEDELEASGRSSVSSNSSTSTVRTKMDATKIEQYLQEKKVNSRT
ncbi:hypothetical protein [Wolbachia endosymbiont (group A) of Andrena dorsata]|uniref:hypothetical protein n=1 Tax=Wolbachia endosymbiont (group A) of Andrena dorsata TaxID=2953975 RepID=UPI0022300371|nr:hypothetical protein [Wolbachia endosymbiont (group A) of Andrena dorsata]